MRGFFGILAIVNWLEAVVKEQKLWIKIVQKFGANKEESKDIVQNMYIRLMDYSSEEKVFKDGKLNHIYIYWALRNTFLIYLKKHRNNTERSINEKIHWDSSYYGGSYYSNIFKRYNSTDSYEERKILGVEKDKEDKYQKVQNKIQKEIKSWHWYDIMLFTQYVESGKSIRTIAKETKMSKDSIFQTLKNCKNKIKESCGEDWQDFKNKDYDKIK